jgi:rsbT co-antagonist protein RsbR
MLILPLIGPIDAKRARQISEQLLSGIRAARARAAVIDVTGVGSMDEVAANSLVQTAEAARLLGAQVVLTGISTDVARTLSMLPVDVSGVLTLGDLQSGIEEAEKIVESTVRSLSAARQPQPLP